MILNEILNDNPPDLSYGGELDLNVKNIQGNPYSLYVNEVAPAFPNGVTFAVSSQEDDGVVWELDLGDPEVSNPGTYHHEPDVGNSGYEGTEWKRNVNNQQDVRVDASGVTSPQLKQMEPNITQALQRCLISSKSSDELERQITSIFQQVIATLNNV